MENTIKKIYWQDVVNLVLGAWLIISPWIMDYSNAGMAAGDAWLLGVGVVIVSLLALISPDVWEEWLNLLLAVFVLISPITVGFIHQDAAVWNSVVISVLIGISAVWGLTRQVKVARP